MPITNQELNILTYFDPALDINGDSASPDSFSTRAIEWITVFRLGHVKNSTIYGDGICPLRHLIGYFRHTSLADISVTMVQAYFNSKRTVLSEETLKKHRCVLNAIFDIARDDGICSKNPVSKRIRISSTITPGKRSAWTMEEYAVAWEFARTHKNGLTIQLLLETAISRSELLGLTWNDFDSENKLLHIRNGLVKCQNFDEMKLELVHDGVKNKYRRRSIPISEELSNRLNGKARSIVVKGKTIMPTYIFHAPEGGPFQPDNWYKRIYKPFMDELTTAHPEISPMRPHELRHTRASMLVNAGINIYVVADMMGHSDLHMLRQRYLHRDLEAMRQALILD